MRCGESSYAESHGDQHHGLVFLLPQATAHVALTIVYIRSDTLGGDET